MTRADGDAGGGDDDSDVPKPAGVNANPKGREVDDGELTMSNRGEDALQMDGNEIIDDDDAGGEVLTVDDNEEVDETLSDGGEIIRG